MRRAVYGLSRAVAVIMIGAPLALRAGSVRLNSFRASISVFLPGLIGFLPHRGWDAGRAYHDQGPTPMRWRKFHAAAAKGRGAK
jgi:hypothetical protein